MTTGIPEWTQRAEKRGLDPLGMQTTSIALYQQLMPGIGNVTLRMRYYGLYTWLSHSYAKHTGNVSPNAWRGYVSNQLSFTGHEAKGCNAAVANRYASITMVNGGMKYVSVSLVPRRILRNPSTRRETISGIACCTQLKADEKPRK